MCVIQRQSIDGVTSHYYEAMKSGMTQRCDFRVTFLFTHFSGVIGSTALRISYEKGRSHHQPFKLETVKEALSEVDVEQA